MSSTNDLASFAARLRRLIRAATNPAECASGDGATLDELALELFALQFEHVAPYRQFCEARRARPDSVTCWKEIPAVPTAAFKEWDLSCLPVEERTTVFHSSGTTGHQPSRHYHNAASLAVYEAGSLAWFAANCPMINSRRPMADGQAGKLTDRTQRTEDGGRKTEDGRRRTEGGGQGSVVKGLMAILTPPPAEVPHSSLVHMFETIRRELDAGESRFVGKVSGDGGWTLEMQAAVELLRRASHTGQPLLMLGTAFSFVHLLDYLGQQGMRFALPIGSCAMETGGYKGRSRSLPKPALHALMSQRLGVSPEHIMCEYGMSELSSQAYDCAIAPTSSTDHGPRTTQHGPRNTQHATRRFQFPPWARVQIISPETGDEAGEGETGLIRVYDLANVYSVMAIQTEDLGVRRGDGFELVGRAPEAEPRGCSLMPA